MVRRVALWVSVVVASAGCNLQNSPLIVMLFGPPTPTLSEAYASDETRASFDHTALDGLLSRHVHGYRVDYLGMQEEQAILDGYIESLADAPFDDLGRDDKLALLINAYNAFTLKLILDHYPTDSIQDIPAADRWDAERWVVGGQTLSLTALEHDELRAKFVEPRIHFAINCASVGCPPLRAEAYVGERIEAQLQEQAQLMHDDEQWVRIDGDTVHLTPLYLWYASDFEQVSGDALTYASQFRPQLSPSEQRIEWMDYDWSLNDVER